MDGSTTFYQQFCGLDFQMPSIGQLHESYVDSSNTSATTSPMNDAYDMSGWYLEQEDADDYSETQHQKEDAQPATKPKRKRENRYKNAPPSVLSRRRAQNRASQRAYRERKDQRIKDLEVLLDQSRQRNTSLVHAFNALQTEYIKLKGEQDSTNEFLLQGAFDPALHVGTSAIDLNIFPYENTVSHNYPE